MTNQFVEHMQGHEGHGGTDSGHDKDHEPGETMGDHVQLMVGKETIYLSHLPMFDPSMPMHHFQVILEVTLNDPEDAQAHYAADRRSHPDVRMYTMVPAAFEMIELDPSAPKRAELTGAVFRGHFERPGKKLIIREATAHIERTVQYHHFDPQAEPLDQLEYFLFGKAPDIFMAHVITRPPDFDQILGVALGDSAQAALSAEDLAGGMRIRIIGRANTPPTRIQAGERFTAQLTGGESGKPVEIELEAGTEFYFEEGELRAVMDMEQTPEERKAGF